MYCFAFRTAARYSGRRKLEVTFSGPRFLAFAHGGVVFRAETAAALSENIANDPQAVLHMIESDEAAIEHQHGVVKADFIAEALGDALDQPHHVIAEIADGPGDQWRQSGKPHGAKTLDARAQEGDGIALFPDHPAATLQDARAIGVAEDFLGVRARKCITRDFFAAFNAFKKEGIPRALGDSQIGADGSQQIRGKNIVDRDEVALFRKALKFTEARLDHGNELTVDRFQFTDKRNLLLHYFKAGPAYSSGPTIFWKKVPRPDKP